MASDIDPTARLVRWACSTRYEDIPIEVRKEAVTLLYDEVGCMIACSTLPSCQPVVNVVRKLGAPGECSVVGHPIRTSINNAALANGTIGHGDEVNPTGQGGTGHFAATIVPTALTVGQYVGASGKEVCRAVALGSEVTGRITEILSAYGKDKFTASTGAAIGVALNAGLLLGLDVEQMEQAVALAASGSCGFYSCNLEELHQIKSLNHGRAAEAGVLAALLAQEGYHGPPEILTTRNGFFDVFLDRPEAGHEAVEGLGEDYHMRQIAYKRYPVGGNNQTPLYAFLQLIRTHEVAAEDVEQIELLVSRNRFGNVLTNKPPALRMEIILALAAVYRDLTFTHIHDPLYREDPRVKAFLERVRLFIVPRSGQANMGTRLQMGITVRTRSGKALHQELRYPLLSEADVKQKFRSYAGLRLDSDRVAILESKLLAIETEKNVTSLVRELELPY